MVAQLQDEKYGVTSLCESLGVSRSAYYAWRKNDWSVRKREDNLLKPMIQNIFWEHKRRYGARRIAVELAARGQPCSRRRVGRLMGDMNLVAIQPRTFKPRTTDSRHSLGYSPNLLIGAPQPRKMNKVWVGDITYVPLIGGDFLYLAHYQDGLKILDVSVPTDPVELAFYDTYPTTPTCPEKRSDEGSPS